jgi:hypothetical protein
MSYEKQNFKPGQVLKAEQLNKIEDGIADVDNGVAKLQPIISTTDITAGSSAPDGRPYYVIE